MKAGKCKCYPNLAVVVTGFADWFAAATIAWRRAAHARMKALCPITAGAVDAGFEKIRGGRSSARSGVPCERGNTRSIESG